MLRPPIPCARRAGLLVVALVAMASQAAAQTTTIVQLPWPGFSAGPRAQDYPPELDERDLYVVEDFTTTSPWFIHQFRCTGADPNGGITGVIAFILDGLPPDGNIVLESTAGGGGGGYVSLPPPQWGYFQTTFGGQRLEPGSYWIMWAAQGPATILPVMFVSNANYSVGQGTPNNAYQYNLGNWWNFPEGDLDPVNADFNHQGPQIGVNFLLQGQAAPPLCRADLNGDGVVNSQDFFVFLSAFFAGNSSADFNADGSITSQDFFEFLAVFFAGC